MAMIISVRRGSHRFMVASFAAVLCAVPASLDRNIKVAPAQSDIEAAPTRSAAPSLHATVAIAARDDRIESRDPGPELAVADPMTSVVLTEPDPKFDAPDLFDQCAAAQDCIDQYLWSVYERTRKIDTIKVPERKKVTVNKKGKKRTITRTIIKLVDEDFTWKDPKAAENVGMTTAQYVIGGMDRSFRLNLYSLLRAMDDAGLAPGMTSGFRDDYRQSIASGLKAANNRSYHGGSLRGGYGYGLAADLVSVKGATRAERWVSTEILWKWIDANGVQYGIGRPYLDKDPPHVAPIDGKEYVDKRLLNAKRAGLETR
jgi:hypothetical protein